MLPFSDFASAPSFLSPPLVLAGVPLFIYPAVHGSIGPFEFWCFLILALLAFIFLCRAPKAPGKLWLLAFFITQFIRYLFVFTLTVYFWSYVDVGQSIARNSKISGYDLIFLADLFPVLLNILGFSFLLIYCVKLAQKPKAPLSAFPVLPVENPPR